MVEGDIPDYTKGEPIESSQDTFTFTNSHAPKTISVSAGKAWAGDDATQNDTRPDSVILTLQYKIGNGEWSDATPEATGVYQAQKTLDDWTQTAAWQDLQAYAVRDGDQGAAAPILYRVVESAVPGYVAS